MPDTVTISRECAEYFSNHTPNHADPIYQMHRRFTAELEAALRSDEGWVKVLSSDDEPDWYETGDERIQKRNNRGNWRTVAYRRSSKDGK